MNDGYRISNIEYWILDIGYCILDCHMTFDFSGQVVLVTGASQGIGEQMAHDFAECGAQLIVTSTSSDDREELVERFGVPTSFYPVDFRSSEYRRIPRPTSLHRADRCLREQRGNHTPLDAASSDDWDVTYITGQSLLVDGGYSIV